ncbi:MAG: NAD(P)H-hydrate dehydratase [Ignavibacteriaceae bacterium]|nr:NAD(P)H-hydrate dehydratase [Ignavibacteriaceae bacterium]
MLPLYTTGQIRQVDSEAINYFSFPSLLLMENAAINSVNIAIDKLGLNSKFDKIAVICGRGNNGGDGYAIARHFAVRGYKVEVFSLYSDAELTPDALVNFRLLSRIKEAMPENIYVGTINSNYYKPALLSATVIIDAILGSGAKGKLSQEIAETVNFLNELPAKKIAIDIPTGIDGDTGFFFSEEAFFADLTISLGELKVGLYTPKALEVCGEIVRGDIGVHHSMYGEIKANKFIIEPEDAYFSLPERERTAHKYSHGRVLAVAGSRFFPGAALLAAHSALKIGAGAVKIAAPASLKNMIFPTNESELVFEFYDDENKGFLAAKALKQLESEFTSGKIILIGPGLGREAQTQKSIVKILKETPELPGVIDADALNAISGGVYKKLNLENKILTPHSGEFAVLTGLKTEDIEKNIYKAGVDFVEETGAYLVLKSSRTMIFTPEGQTYINPLGNSGMAKIGTGDVLTGVIAGLLAQSNDLESAAISGVFLHSLSADLLKETETEYGYTATQIKDNLPGAIKFLQKSFA